MSFKHAFIPTTILPTTTIIQSNQVAAWVFNLSPVLDSNQELIKTIFLLLHVIKLAAQLQQIAEELHCQVNITHILWIPTLVTLVEGVHNSETIERIVLEI